MSDGMTGPRQRTPEWHALRRTLITATDIPVILGLSPYKSESTLALEKAGELPESTPSLVMQIGQALEPVIAAEYERQHGVKLTRYAGLVRHPTIEWAGASPDARRARQRYLVEFKDSRARRWANGVPQDVEAQVQWQLGVTGFPIGDVAALRWSAVETTTIEYDPQMFERLVVIADDFRRRMREGGPFSEDLASVKARYPTDDGTEMTADDELERLVADLLKLRAVRDEAGESAEKIETEIRQRMATATRLVGRDWQISYKRSKDAEKVDWKSIADGLLRQLPDEQRAALISIHTSIEPGSRRFRLTTKGDDK